MMTQDEVDLVLTRLSADCDAMTAALVDLEDHPGRRLLDGAQLSGVTLARWTAAKAQSARLWEDFERYRSILDRARQVRARRGRPGNPELTELTELLTGRVVERSTAAIPLPQRALTGPATRTERVTLPELVELMTSSYHEVAEVVADSEAIWSAFARRLDRAEDTARAARALADSLGLPDRLAAVSAELADTRLLAFSDPLSLATNTHQPDFCRVTRVEDDLAAAHTELRSLARLREDLAGQLARATAAVRKVATAEADAEAARAETEARIGAPRPIRLASALPALRRQLDLAARSGDRHDWPGAAEHLAGLAGAAGAALDRAASAKDSATALLDRRAELRGRLDAYRAKAARLGFAEDADLSSLHAEARALLWTAPCDLPAATRALNRYQKTLADKGLQR
ncbi:hypothetical protein F0L68_28760 [Solihabitans fulvus]|uniref:Uncharacterized protein n=1 Tax=Solihabitans fulvus TaxID=1892852 RepID=A0A5B2WXK9_9PSEU|nr:hypothetical protein [Solihabitans fulvus]KAA2255216.1 hypothetical protein F0L68_28760 [Solihabitans fulvus]